MAFTENAGWALLNVVVGLVVFAVLIALGFVALVVPGLYLLSALFLLEVFVAVEDENFASALESSWRVTSGQRFRTFLLGVAFVVVALVVELLFRAPVTLGLEYGFVFTDLGTAFTNVFGSAVLAAAYNQLSGEGAETTTPP